MARLRACALRAMRRLSEPPIYDKNFSFFSAVHDFEARLIGRTLDETGGNITQAARLLGLTHQTLISILSTRHKALCAKRKPVKPRRRSIIKKPES